MSADDMARDAAGHSALARGWRRIRERIGQMATQSRAAATVTAVRSAIAQTAPTERLRGAGVMLLAATLTQTVLTQFVPANVRPGAPPLLRFAFVAAAIAMIVLAPSIARDWPTSVLRRVLRSRR